MLGLTRRVIANLIAAGFVTPLRGARNAYRFSFQDVVLLRTAHQLREAQIPPRRLLRSLKQLKAKLPDQMPLSGLRIKVIGNDVAVRDADAIWEDPSGQLVMDFELAPPRASSVHPGNWSSVGAPSGAIGSPGKATGAHPSSVGTPSGAIAAVPRETIAPEGVPTKHQRSAAEAAPTKAGLGDGPESGIADLYDRACQLEADGNIAAAANAYRRLLEIAPAHVDAAVNLSALLCEAGHCAKALEICDLAIAAGNELVALLHFNRAIALEDLRGCEPDAQLAYQHTLKLDPTLADAHYNLARLHEKSGRRQAALRHFSAYRRLQKKGL